MAAPCKLQSVCCSLLNRRLLASIAKVIFSENVKRNNGIGSAKARSALRFTNKILNGFGVGLPSVVRWNLCFSHGKCGPGVYRYVVGMTLCIYTHTHTLCIEELIDVCSFLCTENCQHGAYAFKNGTYFYV